MSKTHVESKPIATRHVFFDTQVYRKLKHNPANRALRLLADQIDRHLVVLHTTDITLREVERQLAEEVEASRLALAKTAHDLARWRHTVPDLGPMPQVDDAVTRKLYCAFEAFLTEDCKARCHRAMTNTERVFGDYFERKAPFDQGQKEFPDAFVLKALEAWCEKHSERMLVVTRDSAMLRAAEASPFLLTARTIEDVLAAASASAEVDREAEAIAEHLLNAPEFDHCLEAAIEEHVAELVLDYHGDLPEGQVVDHKIEGVIRFADYRIVSRSSERLGLVVAADTELTADISFEDRSLATFDHEEGVWTGGGRERTEVQSAVRLELYVELEIATGRILGSELLRSDFTIY